MDAFDEILGKADTIHDAWDRAVRLANTAEVRFKAWEARGKDSLMDGGMSAARAEAAVRGGEEWAKFYLIVEERKQDAAKLKEEYQQEIRRFEAERSRQASLRRV